MKSAIIISASSDIGTALSDDWLRKDIQVFGTYRTKSTAVEKLVQEGASLIQCDFSDTSSVDAVTNQLLAECKHWDYLVLCPATQEPFGPFENIDFTEWSKSIEVNFTNQLRILRGLLKSRKAEASPLVLFFAGGGPNKATQNYSAYSVSKVALIKMCELLDAEIPDTRFVILNPGWVKTKSQDKMLELGKKIGADYQRTLEKFRSNDWTPMADVVNCCNWLLEAPRSRIGGRYLGVEFDRWGSEEFNLKLDSDSNLCKLRRRECMPQDHLRGSTK